MGGGGHQTHGPPPILSGHIRLKRSLKKVIFFSLGFTLANSKHRPTPFFKKFLFVGGSEAQKTGIYWRKR